MAVNGLDLKKPHLMTIFTDLWPCRSWTFKSLAGLLKDKQFSCRVAPKSCGQKMETQCSHVNVTVQQFSDWLDGEAKESSPLNNFNRELSSCYIDYKYMKDMFADYPEMFEQVQWKDFGLTGFDGYDSTIWLSSEGANTPGHQDTYGFNLITQISGKKLWILFPPDDCQYLYPTRVPYEESSIFTEVNIRRPDLDSHPKFKLSHPVVVTLSAGQTLYVPRHWWHYVESLEPSISINVWVPLKRDRESHLYEAITRCLATCLINSLDTSNDGVQRTVWLNPTEELAPTTMNLLLLKSALEQLLEITYVGMVSETPGKQILEEEAKHVLKLNQEGDGLKHKEILTEDKECESKPMLNMSSSGDNAPGTDCADTILISSEAVGPSEETSLLNLWKSPCMIINVATPFHFETYVKFSMKRKADFSQSSPPKKQKLESASCSESSIHCADLTANKLVSEMMGAKIFSLNECPFDCYLKFLDDLCRQIHCKQCLGGTKTSLNSQPNHKDLSVSNMIIGAGISHSFVANTDESIEEISKEECGSYGSGSKNACDLLTKSAVDDNNREINLLLQPEGEPSVDSGNKTSENKQEEGDRNAESDSDANNKGDFSQLSLLEVSEDLLTCVLHPEAVAVISRLFEEKCLHRLKLKGLL